MLLNNDTALAFLTDIVECRGSMTPSSLNNLHGYGSTKMEDKYKTDTKVW